MTSRIIFPPHSPFIRVCKGCPHARKIRDNRPNGTVTFLCEADPEKCLAGHDWTITRCNKSEDLTAEEPGERFYMAYAQEHKQ